MTTTLERSSESVQPLAPRHGDVVFTACSANYLGKALAMCRSVLRHQTGVDVVVLLVDRKRHVSLADGRIRLVWAEDSGFPQLLRCAFKYNIIELNTALKPYFAKFLLSRYSKVLYLDPDVCVYGPLDPILQALEGASAVFTPHALSPYEGTGRPSDQDLLRFGAYNLGFFAVADTPQARRLLDWWDSQCRSRCYYEPQLGLGVDQKWIDLAPSFFDSVAILRHPGLNVAFWNLHERRVDRTDEGWTVNGEWPLVFVHFSSFVESDRDAVADKQSRHAAGSRPDFAAAADVYREELASARDVVTLTADYGFACFENGRPITPLLRRIFAALMETHFAACENPFAAAGPVYAFARRRGLLSRGPVAIQHQTFKVVSSYRAEQQIIARIFRVMLRILGPDRYFMLMRYLGHYSSTLNQADLFR